jgi:hypothetical protein
VLVLVLAWMEHWENRHRHFHFQLASVNSCGRVVVRLRSEAAGLGRLFVRRTFVWQTFAHSAMDFGAGRLPPGCIGELLALRKRKRKHKHKAIWGKRFRRSFSIADTCNHSELQ